MLKLIPFTRKYSPNAFVIEDRALAYVYRANVIVISILKI